VFVTTPRKLFLNGTVVTDRVVRKADLLVDGERVAAIGPGLEAPGAQVVDCAGKLLLPGGVDPHTHFDLPMFDTVSSDDHYTGHKAAAFGGTTTVIDFVPQDAGSLSENVARWRAKAEKAAVDYGFHMNVTRLDDAVAAEIPSLPDLGITTLKVFMAYNGRLRLGDADIFKVLRIAEDCGLLVMLHAENGDVIEVLTKEARAAGRTAPEWHARTRPAWGAVDAVLRGCALAAQAGARLYVVHMNAAGEADMLFYARARGVDVMGETCPQYLFFTDDKLRGPDGAAWVCSPPLREPGDNDRLWTALANGEIQVVGTDHCPFFLDGAQPIEYEGAQVCIPGKELGRSDFTKIPNGLPAVGDRLPLLWTHGVGAGRITQEQFVALTSTNPARIFGLYPAKGTLAPGSDADIVVWDPEKHVRYGAAVARHRTDYNLFEGWDLIGFPEKVYLRGTLLVDDGRWLGAPGTGRFRPRTMGEIL
jgi:dihydropyrimidinase